jgi:AcrR family transcriptional regulator
MNTEDSRAKGVLPLMRRSMRSPQTPQALIEATIAVVNELGYAGATLSSIADRAGVTRGAIQHYFGDTRTDLMAAVCAHVLEQRQQQYKAAVVDVARSDFEQARAGMKAAYRDPATWFLIEVWISSKSDEALRGRIDTYLKGDYDPNDAVIASLHKALGSEGVDYRVFKYFASSLTRGLALEHSFRQDPEFLDRVVDFAFDAIEAQAKLERPPTEAGGCRSRIA